MKNITFAILICSLLFIGCEEEPKSIYPEDFSGLNLWLGINAAKPDSLEYNYAFKSLNSVDSIMFSVRLTGFSNAQDRTFRLKPIGGDTTAILEGVHYKLKDYVLKANTYQDVFPVYIYRSSDFKNKSAKVVFGLKENENFKKGITERSDLKIVFRDKFSKPAHWDVDPLPYYRLSTFFGVYSDVKFQFITTIIGEAPVFKVRYTGTPVPPSEISYTRAQYYQNRCKSELIKYNQEHSQPLRDENNVLVVFP